MNILNIILNPVNNFEKLVLERAEIMGIDGAFFFTLGEFESQFLIDLPEEDSDEFEELCNKIIEKLPSLEF